MAVTTTKAGAAGGRRRLIGLAAAAALAVAAAGAEAQPWGGGHRAGAFFESAYQGGGWRGGPRRGPDRMFREGYEAPPPFEPLGGWRRGQVLPPGYRGRDVADPGRYHLRPPPSGYGWVGDERNAYLMQRSTGLVLDSVPGAYEPPPRYAPRDGRGRRGRR